MVQGAKRTARQESLSVGGLCGCVFVGGLSVCLSVCLSSVRLSVCANGTGFLLMDAKGTATQEAYRVHTPRGESWKVLDFSVQNSRTWKVLENHFGPGKSWKLKLKVLESPGKKYLKVMHFLVVQMQNKQQ